MLVSEKYLSKLQNETKFMKIGHTMPELQPFTFHEKFVAHPVQQEDFQRINTKMYFLSLTCFAFVGLTSSYIVRVGCRGAVLS